MSSIFSIVAPQRSGHHAFINTLLLRNNLPLIFINNPKTDKKFYFRPPLARKPKYRLQFNHSASHFFKSIQQVDELENIFYSNDPPKDHELRALFRKNPSLSLIINFEGGYRRQIQVNEYLNKAIEFTKCENVKIIRFTRDPLNLLATKLARSRFYKQEDNKILPAKRIINQQEFLGKFTARFEEDLHFSSQNDLSAIKVDYASWLSDPDYALRKAEELGLITHPPMAQSTIHGGGSSFKSTKPGTAYLERFTRLTGSEPFDGIVKKLDSEIRSYYKQLDISIFTARHPAMSPHANSSDLG